MEKYTLDVEAMDIDDFDFDEVILRDIVVLDTSVTYFNEGIFDRINLKRDIYHHFGTEIESFKVRATSREEGGTNEELMTDRLIEVSYIDLDVSLPYDWLLLKILFM